MNRISIRITNHREIAKKFTNITETRSPALLLSSVRLMLQRNFNSMKNQMIAEFLNLKVTQEIMAGPNASNISGTLSTLSGADYGNLFSFIGFNSSDSPIDVIIEILQSTKLVYVKSIPRYIDFYIDIPTAQTIFEATPMPWADGRSWAQGIEQGISGLGLYIYKSGGAGSSSRSGTAIQTRFGSQSKSRPGLTSFRKTEYGRFNNQPYISSFINEWSKKFSDIKI